MFFMYCNWFKWLWSKYNVMNSVKNWDLLVIAGDDEIDEEVKVCTK